MIAETEESESLNKEHITENIWLNQDKLNRLKAKEAKLNQWKIRQVYEEIEDNEQECISFQTWSKSSIAYWWFWRREKQLYRQPYKL